jgi:hypothetical protein
MRMFKKDQFSLWIEAVGGGTEVRFINHLFWSLCLSREPGFHASSTGFCNGAEYRIVLCHFSG